MSERKILETMVGRTVTKVSLSSYGEYNDTDLLIIEFETGPKIIISPRYSLGDCELLIRTN